MTSGLPESALAVEEGLRPLAEKYGHEYWDRCDAERRWPDEIWAELTKGGWLGLGVPEEHGGSGQGLTELAVALHTLSSAGAGLASSFLFLLTPTFGALTLSRHGTSEQQAELLPGIAAGSLETCFALAEPDAGSDSLSITTRADQDGTDLLVRGQKIWISGASRADWMLLVCRTADFGQRTTDGLSILLVDVAEAQAAGTLVLQKLPKVALNTVPSYSVFFDGVRVPTHRILGERDRGFKVLWDVLNPERVMSAAASVGAADLALSLACRYAQERVVFNRPIGSNQAIAFPLARIKAQVELARLMAFHAAQLWDRGEPCGDYANIAKLAAAEAAWHAADMAMQVYGGMAFSEEYPVARLFRDARVGRTVPVAEELVLSHIATQMLGLPRTF